MIRRRPEVFLDTSYAIALAVESDKHHERAGRLANLIGASGTLMVTSRAVLLEIGNSLAKRQYRPSAVALLDSIEQDAGIEIVEISPTIYSAAKRLFATRLDKDWGLIDCVSFVVMLERAITEALTADVHFQQAGFRSLLLKGD